MSDLRTRIARAICEATTAGKMFPWATLNERDKDTWRDVADAVIAELGLRKEFDAIDHTDEQLASHRYVTDWKADNE